MNRFTTKNWLPVSVAGFVLVMGSLALAQRPKENVSPGRHPNLAGPRSALANKPTRKSSPPRRRMNGICAVTLRKPRIFSKRSVTN